MKATIVRSDGTHVDLEGEPEEIARAIAGVSAIAGIPAPQPVQLQPVPYILPIPVIYPVYPQQLSVRPVTIEPTWTCGADSNTGLSRMRC